MLVTTKEADTLSEFLLRQKSAEIEKKKRMEEERRLRKLYRMNKRINKKKRREMYNYWFENVFIKKILLTTFIKHREVMRKAMNRSK